jgi:uncharacterized paraquat-inducible protein A
MRMAQVCKGFCEDYQSKGTLMKFKYETGQKRCTRCDIFISVDGHRCPCCNTKLRTKPRNSISRKKIYQ